jgi:PTS system mannose-specific IIA component
VVQTQLIGIVLVTHGNLAAEFLAALEHVVGKQPAAAAICIGPDDDMEQRRREILEAVAKCDQGKGVSTLDKANVEVVAGVNLPMLIKLASVRGTLPLTGAVTAAQEAGRKYINVASQLLKASEC